MPSPPCTWTAVCATRWPASAAQNLAVATAAAGPASLVDYGGEQPGGLPHGEPDRLDVDVGVGQALRHRLERADRPPELHPAPRVLRGQLQRPLDDPGLQRAQPHGAPRHQPVGDLRRPAPAPSTRSSSSVTPSSTTRPASAKSVSCCGWTVTPCPTARPGRPSPRPAPWPAPGSRSARGAAGTAVFTPDSTHRPSRRSALADGTRGSSPSSSASAAVSTTEPRPAGAAHRRCWSGEPNSAIAPAPSTIDAR